MKPGTKSRAVVTAHDLALGIAIADHDHPTASRLLSLGKSPALFVRQRQGPPDTPNFPEGVEGPASSSTVGTPPSSVRHRTALALFGTPADQVQPPEWLPEERCRSIATAKVQ